MTDQNGYDPGVGLDVGTGGIVASRHKGKKIFSKRVRNAFIDLPLDNKRMLKLSKTSFLEHSGKLIVLGDEALETANLFNREARRPMSGGLMSAGELDAQEIIGLMLKSILQEPKIPNEPCYYSVPAPAIDVDGSNIIYHEKVLGKILEELGYKPKAINESLAIVFSECPNENFSGVGISFGAGMTNVCLAYNAMSALEFSLGRCGDWVDIGAASAIGSTAAKICAIKENHLDMMNPKNREQEAVVFYLQNLIDYVIKNIIDHFSKAKQEVMVPKPVPIIVSGGTSKSIGFLEKFKEVFKTYESRFPIQISEIRPASDPLAAVSTGLLLLAQEDDEE